MSTPTEKLIKTETGIIWVPAKLVTVLGCQYLVPRNDDDAARALKWGAGAECTEKEYSDPLPWKDARNAHTMVGKATEKTRASASLSPATRRPIATKSTEAIWDEVIAEQNSKLSKGRDF